VHGPGGVGEEEFDGDEIDYDAEGAHDAVFGVAGGAGVVADGDFGDAGADGGAQGRDEPVELAVEPDAFEGGGAVELEGASVIMKPDAGDAADEGVGEPGGYGAGDEAVFAVFAPAAYHVDVFGELGKEGWDVVGVVLEVGVHGDDEGVSGVIDAGGEGGGLAEVALEEDGANAGIGGGDVEDEAGGVVGAAVVDEDEFVGVAVALAGFGYTLVEGLDAARFIVGGGDDGEGGGGRHGGGSG